MGTGFTIDTPIKVAQYGISSVVSLVDDILAENMRKYYSNKFNIPFNPISSKSDDFRALRFTEYLNLLDNLIKEKFEDIKKSYKKNIDEIHKYLDFLPDAALLKSEFNNLIKNNTYIKKIEDWLDQHLHLGSIDVNIMTKLDKENYRKSEKLPHIYNDAHASLRGYANSNLESSLVLSAGMNPRLYGYLENFEDFFPDEKGFLKKKIVIKVSDFRSALIQGKFLAKKGLWVSEYRIESGLNCGGHAFATDGYLMGPILEEFKTRRDELVETVYPMYKKGLEERNKNLPDTQLSQKITAQGGVGTSGEHNFLLDYYNLDSIGWGTPFLLVPEVTNVDEETLTLLKNAGEKDLYLSKISPLGVPFNTVRGSSQERDKLSLAENGRPGSSCPKKFLTFNTEFTEKVICTASRQYQNLKLDELENSESSFDDLHSKRERIIEKECLCIGLANSTKHIHNSDNIKSEGVSVCPGPNLAYFSEVFSLKEMVDHIYNRINLMKDKSRPNLFIKELSLYHKYLKSKIDEIESPFSEKQLAYFNKFIENMNDGIKYYKLLFGDMKDKIDDVKDEFLVELERLETSINELLYPLIPSKAG